MGGRVRDLTGQKFGELTVLQDTGERQRGGGVVWLCRCSCGKICKASGNALTARRKKSCGHIKVRDLSGLRFGRLVAIRPIRRRIESQLDSFVWLCKCDCGGVTIATVPNLVNGIKKSCGCLLRGPGKGYAVCPSCGERFLIQIDGNPTPQFCDKCAPKYEGRNWKVCPICRKLFPSPESDKTVTCSKECSAEWKSMMHDGVSNKWNEEAKEKKRKQGQTENLKMGTPAAIESPISGRFETNRGAKVWTLIDPSGNEITVRNLLMWARKNTERFGKPEGDKSAKQIADGFKAIALTMRGKRKHPSMTYFGWTLKDAPKEPEE